MISKYSSAVLIRDRDSMLRSYLLWQKGVNDRIMYSLQKANDAESGAVKEKTVEVAKKEKLIKAALEYFENKG